MTYEASYDPADNKCRLRCAARLDPETYARVKTLGFQWAPKQDLWVAPWSPEREDLLLELAGDIGDEDTSLVERAEERADRFEQYSENRRADYEAAHKAVAAIADNIPLAQPILVGHHSEKRARRDAEKIQSGMRKAVRMWETSRYWTDRAAGAIRAAKYKERPDVRERRIKGLEADLRKVSRNRDQSDTMAWLWVRLGEEGFRDRKKDGTATTLAERARFIANLDRDYQTWSDLDAGKITPDEARAQRVQSLCAYMDTARRWIAHLRNRLAYERAMLDESGWTPPARPKTSAALPLLNYSGRVAYRNPYHRDEVIEGDAVGLTKAELAKIAPDYNGTRVSACGTHRVRTAMLHRGQGAERYGISVVFLTDSKQHQRPTAEAIEAKAIEEHQEKLAAVEDRVARQIDAARRPETPAAVDAMRATLHAGVQVVSAPQLFPTPRALAARMVELASIEPGHRVLEPSAGTGRLVDALDAVPGAEVVAVEVSATLADRLRLRSNTKHDVRCADFLACNGDLGTFDRVVMNPPFRDGEDIKHILHARSMLRPDGRLVALCANGPRQQERLRPLASQWADLPAGTFDGTDVRAALLVIEA